MIPFQFVRIAAISVLAFAGWPTVCTAEILAENATSNGSTPGEPVILPTFPRKGGTIYLDSAVLPKIHAHPPLLADPASTPAPDVASKNRPARQPDPAVVAEMQQLSQAGLDAFAKGNDAVAWENLDKADKLVPNQASIQICKALILNRRGKIAEAAVLYDRAVEIQPKSVPMRAMRAGFRMDQKEYAKAREDLMAAMEVAPGDEGLRFNVIITYLLEKNRNAARLELDKFKQPSDTAAYYFASSAVAYSGGQVKSSIDWISSGYRIFGVRRCTPFYTTLRRAGLLKVLNKPYYPGLTLGGVKE